MRWGGEGKGCRLIQGVQSLPCSETLVYTQRISTRPKKCPPPKKTIFDAKIQKIKIEGRKHMPKRSKVHISKQQTLSTSEHATL